MMRDGECWEREMPEHLTSGTESGSWPTPTCADSWNPSTMKSAEREWTQGNLRGIAAAPVKMWPTPKASAAGPDLAKLKRSATGISLQTAVTLWPTPVASDHNQRRPTENWEGSDLVSVVTTSEEEEGRMQPKAGGQLNPNWVEWLMGWPIGWTALNVSAMDKSPSVQHWPGES